MRRHINPMHPPHNLRYADAEQIGIVCTQDLFTVRLIDGVQRGDGAGMHTICSMLRSKTNMAAPTCVENYVT